MHLAPAPWSSNTEALIFCRGRKPSGDSNKGIYALPPPKMHTKACPQFQGFPVSLEAHMSPSLRFPFESNLHQRRLGLRTLPRLWGHRPAGNLSSSVRGNRLRPVYQGSTLDHLSGTSCWGHCNALVLLGQPRGRAEPLGEVFFFFFFKLIVLSH